MKATKKTSELAKTRMMQDFIITELVKGNIETKDDVLKYICLVEKKLGVGRLRACKIVRDAIG